MARRLIAVVLMIVGTALLVPAAQADTGDILELQHEPPNAKDGWQAGTCTTDTPTPTTKCSPATPEIFYKQAGGHPQIGFTQYTIKHKVISEGVLEEPVGILKTLRVDLPPGLTVNPEATPRCPLADFEKEPTACSAESIIGREEVTVALNVEIPNPFPPPPATLPPNFVISPTPALGTLVPLYNIEPKFGEPALFGFKVGSAKSKVFLTTDVDWAGDYHESFQIVTPPPSALFKTLKSRLVNEGRKGDGTYITNPTTCFDPQQTPFQQTYSTFIRAESIAEPALSFPSSLTPFEAKLPGGQHQENCSKVPFDPSLEVVPGTDSVDSPAAPTVTTNLPFITGGETISSSHLRNATIALPEGMGLNPSAANGLESCTDAQFGKGTTNPVSCPAGSKIGTVDVDTPPLPVGSLKGDVFLGQQLSRDPTSGEEFRIFIDAESARYGISARLIGNVSADPTTGQLTTKLAENPQVPFRSVTLHFDEAKGLLTSPPTCATATTTSTMEPWSTPLSTKSPSTAFELTSAPGGGACPKTLAERPFAPGYEAKVSNNKAGAYSPFRVHIARPDGQQELKGVDVTLPAGLTGKLAGIPYCPDSSLAAAAGNSGVAERAASSCPRRSAIGTASTESGTGPNPLKIDGNAYLAGPYKGAPISLAVITPAVAGPFDLGTVVVRVALFVNPRTAQVESVSDQIPDVFGGVKLDIRSVNVNLNRKRFMRNPTSCGKKAVTGALHGGGANPTDPAAFSNFPISTPLRFNGCKKLGFAPHLSTTLLGNATRRTGHPPLKAVLTAREGDANVSRSALSLPHSLFLDQSHIKTVCTRAQLASHTCPKAAIYGHAKAKTPLLTNPLKGPVYMVSSKHELPDLVADLRGQVNIQLHGVISSVRGGIKTVFNPLPDVPVRKFTLMMKGGDHGLLVNSTNLCEGPQFSVLNMKAHNGKHVRTNRLPLKVDGCR